MIFMSEPLISVIIPVYNHYSELFRTLKNLFQQSVSKRDLEVIVVDDGSEFPGVRQDQELLKIALPGVKFFKIEHKGAAAARNFGFEKSSGRFVIFWDADLEADRSFLEKLLAALEKYPQAGYAYSSFYFGWKKFPARPFDADQLRKNNFIPMSSLIKREVFASFDETLDKFQDWDLWLTLLERNQTGVWVPEFLFKARTRCGSLSSWLPSFMYKMSWLPLPALKKYFYWKSKIIKKHHLT